MGGVLGGVLRPRPDLGLLDLVDKLEKQNAKASIDDTNQSTVPKSPIVP